MPQIIKSPYTDSSMGDQLFGIGGLTDAFFGPKASQSALVREKFKEAQRQNEFLPQYAAEVGRGGSPGRIAELGILANQTGQDVSNYGRYVTLNNNPNDLAGNRATAAMLAAGTPFPATAQGDAAHLANTRTIAEMQAEKARETQLALDARTTANVYDASGRPTTVLRSGSIGLPPVLPLEQEKAAELRRLGIFGGGSAPAATAPAWPAPGAPANTSIMTAPITDASTFAPSFAAPPTSARPPISADTRIALGLDPKDPGGDNVFIYNAAGEKVRQYVSPDNGRTDDAGNPITLGPGESKQLVGKTNTNAGAPGSTGLRDKLVESRVAHRVLIGSVDNMIAALDKEGAGAALGLVGKGATFIDNLRAQTDALTGAAKDLGFGRYADIFNASAQQYYDTTPGLKQWAEARNIDRSTMLSRMSSLAYAMARADDPRGDISNKAVDSKMAELGAKLQNPVAFKAVLQDLKARSEFQHRIREEETMRILPPEVRSSLGGAPTATGATPAAPAAALDPETEALVRRYGGGGTP